MLIHAYPRKKPVTVELFGKNYKFVANDNGVRLHANLGGQISPALLPSVVNSYIARYLAERPRES